MERKKSQICLLESLKALCQTHRSFIVKMSVLTNFMCLPLKVPSDICKKVVSLDLRTTLNFCENRSKGGAMVLLVYKMLIIRNDIDKFCVCVAE